MKQTKEDRLISEAYQQIFEKQVQAQLDEGVLNKLKSLALVGAVAAGSASAAPNSFNAPFKSADLTSQIQNSPSAKGIIYQNNGWSAVELSSKPGCLIFSKTNKNVQVSVGKDGTATINVSYKDRGGVEAYRYLVDGGRTPLQPGEEEQSVSNPNEDIKIPFAQAVQEGTRLAVMVVSTQGKGYTDIIDIGSLKDAVSACQKAMAQ